ncbi:hypothetical protein G7Z17_g5390 [Cylindrodendrum hubeiense]|uniref:F-box domain-containing protein n=1 Tax=Cylindrodendrum hubeiense TaxID=595255 RepID=A0A9P5HC50_9HYPO|nr:hypothetical protein G7Z17_g5390 [Cylindrodendrum hubeiense]
MALNTSIESLPAELLYRVFSFVDEKKSIQQSRLVSHQFKDVASSFLITKTHVYVSSECISKLEELCDHPVYSKSITRVNINISCYDVDMASNRALYMEDCHTRLFQLVDMFDRIRAYRYNMDEETWEETKERLQELVTNEELTKISEEDFEESSATPFQKLAMRLHAMYKQRCNDQESVRQGNKHIGRICAALCKLPKLEELSFYDAPGFVREKPKDSDFKDLTFDRTILKHFNFALWPSKWCGTFTTAYSIVPPVEMLGELCSQLGQHGIRPRSITMNLNAPANLRPIGLSSNQQSGLRSLVSKATRLRLVVDGWARKNSLAENNDRPRDEMLALCSFSQHFFSSPDLESLYIHFVEYPRFYERPNVSLSDILPMQKPWPQLSDLELRYQAAKIDDLRALVELQGDTVKNFNWECGWLLSGGWNEAIEVLRGFGSMEKLSMKFPRGERYGEGRGMHGEIPYDQIYSYILKETDVNPLGYGNIADQ